jgi:hypothetical protein
MSLVFLEFGSLATLATMLCKTIISELNKVGNAPIVCARGPLNQEHKPSHLPSANRSMIWSMVNLKIPMTATSN